MCVCVCVDVADFVHGSIMDFHSWKPILVLFIQTNCLSLWWWNAVMKCCYNNKIIIWLILVEYVVKSTELMVLRAAASFKLISFLFSFLFMVKTRIPIILLQKSFSKKKTKITCVTLFISCNGNENTAICFLFKLNILS